MDITDLHLPLRALGGVSLTAPVASDRDAVALAAGSDETWRYFSYRADGQYFSAYWTHFHETPTPHDEVRWIVRHDGKIVGSTSYLAVVAQHRRLEIGGTWYSADARGGIVNPVCKYVLLERAFACGYRRVEIKTDSRNARSRAAIEKLGAKFEGIHRKHMINHDASQRDTVYYSITDEDWPGVRAKLAARLAGLGVQVNAA